MRICCKELKQAYIEAVKCALQHHEPMRNCVQYVRNNLVLMQYEIFRQSGLFIGTEVVERGCKSDVRLSLKQSGMYGSVEGAILINA